MFRRFRDRAADDAGSRCTTTMRTSVVMILAAMLTATGFVIGAGAAEAAPSWNGQWTLTRYAASKTGTSLAARQREPDFSNVYTFATRCSAGKCVATVVDGPPAANPTIPRPPRYTWNGVTWMEQFDWQWDCYMGAGKPKVWAPAHSVAWYTPQRDGTKTGTWRTVIDSGPCRGTVVMAVKATPKTAVPGFPGS